MMAPARLKRETRGASDGVDRAFDRDRNAVQRTQRPAGPDGVVGLLRLKPRPVFIDGHKRVEFWIPSLNLTEMRLEQLSRTKASVANTRGHLPCRKVR